MTAEEIIRTALLVCLSVFIRKDYIILDKECTVIIQQQLFFLRFFCSYHHFSGIFKSNKVKLKYICLVFIFYRRFNVQASKITQISTDGFHGYYYSSFRSDKCIIVIIGDKGNDFMNTSCARWLTTTQNCNVLCLGVRQEVHQDSGIHSWPLEYIECAVNWLKHQNIRKIGVLGMSMQGTLVLAAASFIPDISLVIALTPCDYIPWGFCHGKLGKSSNAEWPSGTSTFTWRGQELPWQPACLEKEAYWNMFLSDKSRYHEMHTISIFEYSERMHPISPECFINVENINGKIILIGAEDDVMWNSSKYIRRMKKRLNAGGFLFPCASYIYPYGTHLLVPERMLKKAIPLFGSMIYKLYVSGRKHPDECTQSRIDLDEKLTLEIQNW